METTLLYFFSAIFQGIAAILTLGAMFFINYQDRVKSRINELIEKTPIVYTGSNLNAAKLIAMKNIVEAMRDFLQSTKAEKDYTLHYQIVNEYNEITSRLEKIKNIMPSLIFQGITLLTLSSIALFGVGYSKVLNEILLYIGIIVLIITSTFLKNLVSILRITTDIGALKLKDLFFIAKANKQK